MQFNLNEAAKNVVLRITTGTGAVLLEKEMGAMPKGTQEFAWDGIDQNGNLVSDGEYYFEVFAEGSNGQNVAQSAFTSGEVTAVRFINGMAYLVVNNVEIPITEITEILPGYGEA
ncbi:flagellar hook assembly protein FlgD, partial [candidate division KSB1 bacterium]